MTQFFTTKELSGLDYIPQGKIAVLAQDLDRILKLRVAGNNDATWVKFIAEYPVGTYGATGTAKVDVHSNM